MPTPRAEWGLIMYTLSVAFHPQGRISPRQIVGDEAPAYSSGDLVVRANGSLPVSFLENDPLFVLAAGSPIVDGEIGTAGLAQAWLNRHPDRGGGRHLHLDWPHGRGGHLPELCCRPAPRRYGARRAARRVAEPALSLSKGRSALSRGARPGSGSRGRDHPPLFCAVQVV